MFQKFNTCQEQIFSHLIIFFEKYRRALITWIMIWQKKIYREFELLKKNTFFSMYRLWGENKIKIHIFSETYFKENQFKPKANIASVYFTVKNSVICDSQEFFNFLKSFNVVQTVIANLVFKNESNILKELVINWRRLLQIICHHIIFSHPWHQFVWILSRIYNNQQYLHLYETLK